MTKEVLHCIESPGDEFGRAVAAADPTADFTQTPDFLRFCELAVPNCQARPLGLTFDDGTRVFFPLVARQEGRGLAQRYESTFRGYGGPIADRLLSVERSRSVLDAAIRWCAAHRMTSLWIRTPPGSTALDSLPKIQSPLATTSENSSSDTLALPAVASDLSRAFNKGRKAAIHRAEKLGVEVSQARHEADYREFSAVYDDRVRRWGDAAKSKFTLEFFLAVAEFARQSQDMRLWLARCEGQVQAGAVVLYHGQRASYWIGASLADDSKRANAYLHFRIMEDAIERGAKVYDMGRSGTEGVQAFKASFGARPQPCQVLTVNNLLLQRVLGAGYETLRLLQWPLRKLRG